MTDIALLTAFVMAGDYRRTSVAEYPELLPIKFSPVEDVFFGVTDKGEPIRGKNTITAPNRVIRSHSSYAYITTIQKGMTAPTDNFLPIDLRGKHFDMGPPFKEAFNTKSECWKYFDDSPNHSHKFGMYAAVPVCCC